MGLGLGLGWKLRAPCVMHPLRTGTHRPAWLAVGS